MVVDRPTTADLADWMGIDEATGGSSLQWALDAALEAQDAACWTAPYTRALHIAALRRAAQRAGVPWPYTARGRPDLRRRT